MIKEIKNWKKAAVLERVADEQMEKMVGRQAKRIRRRQSFLCPVRTGS